MRSASARDLLAVGIAKGESATAEAEALALKLIRTSGNLRKVAELCIADLEALGMGLEEALRALAWLELGRRIGLAGKGPVDTILKSEHVAALLDHLADEQKEHFVAVLLDAKNQVRRVCTVHIGSLTMSIVSARDVFREAVKEGAAAVVVAHNHPSGDPTPSPEDVAITEKLIEAGKLLEIPVLDHVVIGYRRHVSLREKGFIHD
jgi:DNA repair protein RadC